MKPALFLDPCNILALLPYSANTELVSKQQKIDDLYFIKAVIEFSINALELFLAEHLFAFDAQVGENLCQIRAYKIVHLAKKWLSTLILKEEFIEEIERVKAYKHHLDEIIYEWENAINHSTSYNKALDGHEKITDFLTRHNLLLDLQEDFVFIIACCFLTHFNLRDDNIPVAINLQYISREFHISKYRAKRLTHKYQQVVCILGCQFILTIADELPLNFGYREVLPNLYKIADEDRAVLPCYLISEIIFYHSIQKKIPVLLVIRRIQEPANHATDVIYFLLKGNENNNYDILPCQPYLQDNCLITAGDVHYTHESVLDYIERLLKDDLLKIILANTASHPQYAGKRLMALRHNPFALEDELTSTITNHINNLNTMKSYAKTAGCCYENRTSFFLRHIYANKLKNEITQLNTKYIEHAYDAYTIRNP